MSLSPPAIADPRTRIFRSIGDRQSRGQLANDFARKLRHLIGGASFPNEESLRDAVYRGTRISNDLVAGDGRTALDELPPKAMSSMGRRHRSQRCAVGPEQPELRDALSVSSLRMMATLGPAGVDQPCVPTFVSQVNVPHFTALAGVIVQPQTTAPVQAP